METLVSTILPYVGSRGDVKRILAGLSRAREELSITAGRFYMGGMTIPRDFMGVEEALHRCKRMAGEVLRVAALDVLAGEWRESGEFNGDDGSMEGVSGNGSTEGVKNGRLMDEMKGDDSMRDL